MALIGRPICCMLALHWRTVTARDLSDECRKPRAGHWNTDHVVCFQCNQVGHKRNACPMNRPNRSAGPQRVAAMQHFTAHTPTHNYNGPHHCNESRGDGEIKLAYGCMMPVVAGALSRDRQEVIKMWKTKRERERERERERNLLTTYNQWNSVKQWLLIN